jgi:hypothetical protein
MRRKTDFFTYDEKARNLVNTPLNEHLKIYQESKAREAAIKKK